MNQRQQWCIIKINTNQYLLKILIKKENLEEKKSNESIKTCTSIIFKCTLVSFKKNI